MDTKEEIIRFIKVMIAQYEYQGAVVGISGGIDSAVVAALCVNALGKDKVLGLLLPERDSAPETLTDSIAVCDYLGIDRIIKPITGILKKMGIYKLQPSSLLVPRKIQEKYVKNKLKSIAEEDVFLQDLQNKGDQEMLNGQAYYRAKHRIRMACLYFEAEKRNYAVIGTTNHTEAMTGFYVKWGDDSSDIEPLAHLYKTQVYAIAEELKIPRAIKAKAPSPDLIPGITDEYILGLTYPELDGILIKIENNLPLNGIAHEKIDRVQQIIKAAQKRNLRNATLGLIVGG